MRGHSGGHIMRGITIMYALIDQTGKILAKYNTLDTAIKECLFYEWENPWEKITIALTN
jgi:hypothetical protein